ncbi:hypothetical protein [Brevundimonas sp.]|uniref:hypothetical protein n=1 Tax=Brevundimonas sp. TaxID=1871086 RepID=UPI0035AF8881
MPDILSRPAKLYGLRTIGFLGLHALVLLLLIAAPAEFRGFSIAWILVAAIMAPILGQTWAVLVFMRDSDEVVRALTARRFIVAAGLALSVFAGWGFAETFANAPHLEGYYVYALFWGAFALVTPLIRSTQ